MEIIMEGFMDEWPSEKIHMTWSRKNKEIIYCLWHTAQYTQEICMSGATDTHQRIDHASKECQYGFPSHINTQAPFCWEITKTSDWWFMLLFHLERTWTAIYGWFHYFHSHQPSWMPHLFHDWYLGSFEISKWPRSWTRQIKPNMYITHRHSRIVVRNEMYIHSNAFIMLSLTHG